MTILLYCVYRIRTIIMGKISSILHNQTTTVETMNSEHDEYITTESAVAHPKNNEFFVSATMFDQAKIDSHLLDERAMEEANNCLLQDTSSFSSVSDTSLELSAHGCTRNVNLLSQENATLQSHSNWCK